MCAFLGVAGSHAARAEDAAVSTQPEGTCETPTGVTSAPPPEATLPPAEEPSKSTNEAPTLSPVEPVVVSHVSNAGRRIALTFDACSVSEGKASRYDDRITKVLVKTKTPATIFLGGRWANNQQKHVKELGKYSFIELGNHTWSHPPMTRIKPERVRSELQRTQDEIYRLTGSQPRYFRPPFGEYNQEVVAEAAKLGLQTVEFDLASGDPDKHATKERLIEWVLRKAMPGSIIVMHINRRGWHTAEALPAIIQGLHKRGYQLVTVGDLLKHGTPDPTVKEVLTIAGRGRRTASKATHCSGVGARSGVAPGDCERGSASKTKHL
jgi:peptidoglycan/xylan/chitin deacetylase (PgdA/CDA1 family)